jgi:hypothetical protein
MGQAISLLCKTGGTVRGPPAQAQDGGKNLKSHLNFYWFIVTALTCSTTFYFRHFPQKYFVLEKMAFICLGGNQMGILQYVIATKRAQSQFYISAVGGCQGSSAANDSQVGQCFQPVLSLVYFISGLSHGKLNTWKRRLGAFSENPFLLIF